MYKSNMLAYDDDLKNITREKGKTQDEYDDTLNDLNNMKEEYGFLLEEKRKRDEISAIMAKKKNEQEAKMNKLINATEYIQAHWRGMLERKIADKARKGKKKKKKKK